VSTRKRYPNNSFPALAVGLTVLAAAVAAGGIAGGVFKPAVGVDGGIIALVGWPAVFVFFVAEFVAAVVAGFALRALNAGSGSKSRESPVPAPGPPPGAMIVTTAAAHPTRRRTRPRPPPA
jgi:glycerol uptake facilitator-like aquaporin